MADMMVKRWSRAMWDLKQPKMEYEYTFMVKVVFGEVFESQHHPEPEGRPAERKTPDIQASSPS